MRNVPKVRITDSRAVFGCGYFPSSTQLSRVELSEELLDSDNHMNGSTLEPFQELTVVSFQGSNANLVELTT